MTILRLKRKIAETVRCLRLRKGDDEAIQKYFVRMQKQNSQFYYAMDVDDESRLRNVFWAYARCRVAYEYFDGFHFSRCHSLILTSSFLKPLLPETHF